MRSLPRLTLALFVAAAGCGHGQDPDISPTFASINTNVIQKKCTECHTGSASRGGGLAFDTYALVISSGGVVAGNAAGSNLFNDVNSGKMPKSGDKLTDQNIQAIKDWIQNGAADN